MPRRRALTAPADANYGATNDRKLQGDPDVPEDDLKRRMDRKYKELQDRVPDEEATRDIEARTRGQADNDEWHKVLSDQAPGTAESST